MTSASVARETSRPYLKVATVAMMISFLDVAIVVLMGVAIVACNVTNSNFAPDNACLTGRQCAAPTGVCVLEERTCVQCTVAEASACVGTTPVCGTDNTQRLRLGSVLAGWGVCHGGSGGLCGVPSGGSYL
jgi:hypothetical protein